jgi:hypothetical protein
MDVQRIPPSAQAEKSWNAFVQRTRINISYSSGELTPIIEMWSGGPRRLASLTMQPNFLLSANGIYVGPYVCRSCRTVAHGGVYGPAWLCADCLTIVRNALLSPAKEHSGDDPGQHGSREGQAARR